MSDNNVSCIEFPSPPEWGSKDLLRAVVAKTIRTSDEPDPAGDRARRECTEGRWLAHQIERRLEDYDDALRTIIQSAASTLRDLHEGTIRTSSGFGVIDSALRSAQTAPVEVRALIEATVAAEYRSERATTDSTAGGVL